MLGPLKSIIARFYCTSHITFSPLPLNSAYCIEFVIHHLIFFFVLDFAWQKGVFMVDWNMNFETTYKLFWQDFTLAQFRDLLWTNIGVFFSITFCVADDFFENPACFQVVEHYVLLCRSCFPSGACSGGCTSSSDRAIAVLARMPIFGWSSTNFWLHSIHTFVEVYIVQTTCWENWRRKTYWSQTALYVLASGVWQKWQMSKSSFWSLQRDS